MDKKTRLTEKHARHLLTDMGRALPEESKKRIVFKLLKQTEKERYPYLTD
jgi:hypothetical protein